jgi:hypothetical protein
MLKKGAGERDRNSYNICFLWDTILRFLICRVVAGTVVIGVGIYGISDLIKNKTFFIRFVMLLLKLLFVGSGGVIKNGK